MTKWTVESALNALKFNWRKGKVYVPTHHTDSGLEEWKRGDSTLQQPLHSTTQSWHFHATDPEYFYCAVSAASSLPPEVVRVVKADWTVCAVNLEDLELVQINPDSLGEAVASVHRCLVADRDILVGPTSRHLFPEFGSQEYAYVAGLKEYGVFTAGKTESDALLALPRLIGMFGILAFHGGYNQGLVRYVMDTSSAGLMEDLRHAAGRLKEQADNPDSELNKKIDRMFG